VAVTGALETPAQAASQAPTAAAAAAASITNGRSGRRRQKHKHRYSRLHVYTPGNQKPLPILSL
jgi:hypothetical protein